MDGLFTFQDNRLFWRRDGECLVIEPWGSGSLRVRAGNASSLHGEDWALLPADVRAGDYERDEHGASLTNGLIRAHVTNNGRLTFYNARGETLLRECVRDHTGEEPVSEIYSLGVSGREFFPLPGGCVKVTARFEAVDTEKIFGMGQYQEPYLNLKGCQLELAQRNSQASVPFYISSIGYGFLWNNPGVGGVSFARNKTEWTAEYCDGLDYWITAGNSPAQILEQYTSVTGRAPIMPEYGLGLWQCKLRYRSQEEILSVAREYKERGLPLSVIVVDYFHWPMQGEWRFDEKYFPDPEGMIRELNAMGVRLMVSVWPTVDRRSRHYEEMSARGLLVRSRQGVDIQMYHRGAQRFFDATNPEARAYVWQKCKENYFDKGVSLFWLDEAEPEYSVYDYGNYDYHAGPVIKTGNLYPREYARAFFEGMRDAGVENPMHLIRCCWAGSQRYGALLWSGDISSSFESLRCQVAAGLNAGMAGIPWWTTDIGGFYGGQADDPNFRELIVRWFQWATFTPVLRMHGFRLPSEYPDNGDCPTGAGNELWSYGEEVYCILRRYLMLRESLRPYLSKQMALAHETGAPPMRPVCFDFPHDLHTWEVEDEFMLGPDYLVAPVTYPGMRERQVYLPYGCDWAPLSGGEAFRGGQTITCETPLEDIPVFVRA